MKIPQKNAVEWSVFGLSLLLVVAVGGFLAYDAVAGVDSPPALVVRPGAPVQRGDVLEIPVLVENTGGAAAEDVLVEVTVRQSGGAEERAELTLPLLPRLAVRDGVVSVPSAGAVESVEGRVVGYTLP